MLKYPKEKTVKRNEMLMCILKYSREKTVRRKPNPCLYAKILPDNNSSKFTVNILLCFLE